MPGWRQLEAWDGRTGTDLAFAICRERFAPPGKTAKRDATLAWFAERGVPCVAITPRGRPILGLDGGRRFEIEVPATAVVDTLGAGDMLLGAFCFHAANGGAFEESLRRAAKIATRSCLGLGIEATIRESGDA